MEPINDLGARMIRLSLSANPAQPSAWALAASHGRSLRGRPNGCAGCPLRAGGEWEDRKPLLAALPAEVRDGVAKRWWCHQNTGRPCAGMVAACKSSREEP